MNLADSTAGPVDHRRPSRRRPAIVWLWLAVAVAVTGMSLATAPTAGADPSARLRSGLLPSIDLVCPLSFEFDFVPPLTAHTTATALTSAALTSCLSPDGKSPLLAGILFANESNASATGCSPLPLVVSGTANVLWNDNTTSVVNFKISTDLSKGLALGGSVVSGPLTGDKIIALPLLLAQNGSCLTGGVKSLTVALGVDLFYH